MVFFYALGSVIFIRLLLEVTELTAWPLCCLQRSCKTPLSVQQITEGRANAKAHRIYSLDELFRQFLPSFVTKDMGINNVIEDLDATNVTLVFLCRTGEQSWRQKIFPWFFAKDCSVMDTDS